MTESEACRPVYCVGGPCAPTCLRMDDPKPIELRPDRLATTAARIREARDGLSDDRMPDIPLRRAADLYDGRSAPTARELALYAEACQVNLDWLLTGATDGDVCDTPATAEPNTPATEPSPAEALARHLADQPVSVLQAAARLLGMRLTNEEDRP